jgi:hypothetical protein
MDGGTVILAIKCNVHDMLFLHGHLRATLVSDSLLFALSFLSVGQQHRLSGCFQLHCKYWLEAIVIPVYIQIVVYKRLAMLQYPFVGVATIWLETPITVEQYPFVPAPIMIQWRYLNHPRTVIQYVWAKHMMELIFQS